MSEEQIVHQIRELAGELSMSGRYDLLLSAIGNATLQRLNIEAAKATLSPLVITKDYRFLLPDYNAEVDIEPIHKALYIFYLRHTEGIITKHMVDYRDEIIELYKEVGNRISARKVSESIDRLVNPLDNSLNEKCARIKSAFSMLMDKNQLHYYIISNYTKRHIDGFNKVWFERKKSIAFPRHLVIYEK